MTNKGQLHSEPAPEMKARPVIKVMIQSYRERATQSLITSKPFPYGRYKVRDGEEYPVTHFISTLGADLALATNIMTSLTPAIASLGPSRVASLSDLDRVISTSTAEETEPLLEANQEITEYGTHRSSTQNCLPLDVCLFLVGS